MDASVTYRPGRHPQDTEDIAYEFIEQEVGRHDWRHNWPKFKAALNTDEAVRIRVQRWLEHMGIDYAPEEIIKFLDDMTTNRNGIWR